MSIPKPFNGCCGEAWLTCPWLCSEDGAGSQREVLVWAGNAPPSPGESGVLIVNFVSVTI